MTNKEIQNKFKSLFIEEDYVETSRLHAAEFFTDKLEVLHVNIYGGMNGWGDFKDYLYDLYEVLDALEANGVYAYIVDMNIDALDDLFKVELVLRDLKEFYSGKPE